MNSPFLISVTFLLIVKDLTILHFSYLYYSLNGPFVQVKDWYDGFMTTAGKL